MTSEELAVVTRSIGGVQAAIAHLVNLMDAKGILNRAEVAGSFDETAEAISSGPKGVVEVGTALRQIATMIRGMTPREAQADAKKLN